MYVILCTSTVQYQLEIKQNATHRKCTKYWCFTRVFLTLIVVFCSLYRWRYHFKYERSCVHADAGWSGSAEVTRWSTRVSVDRRSNFGQRNARQRKVSFAMNFWLVRKMCDPMYVSKGFEDVDFWKDTLKVISNFPWKNIRRTSYVRTMFEGTSIWEFWWWSCREMNISSFLTLPDLTKNHYSDKYGVLKEKKND